MTKRELFEAYENLKDKADCIVLKIHMPTGETETIINPNVCAKMEYINKTYSDELVHSNCADIYIEDVAFCFPRDGETFDFGEAIAVLKNGGKVARGGWNGKGMFLYYVPESAYPPVTEIARATFNGNNVPYGAYIAMKTAQNNVVPWLASQTDMLADDWYEIE